MPTARKTFMDKLADAVREAGVRTVAGKIDEKPPQVSRWINGERSPRVDQMLRMAKAVGMTVTITKN